MLVANEHQEELDGRHDSIESIWPAVFFVVAQKILLGMFFSRQLTLPEDVHQPIQILTVTRLVQSNLPQEVGRDPVGDVEPRLNDIVNLMK